MEGQLANKPRTVAARIDRSVSFVYEEMAAGRLPYVIVGKTRMVLEDDLQRYAESLRGTDGVSRLLGLIDDDGRIDVAQIPSDCTLADLESAKRVVAERQAVA